MRRHGKTYINGNTVLDIHNQKLTRLFTMAAMRTIVDDLPYIDHEYSDSALRDAVSI